MICGPEVMMRFVSTALQDRGVAAESIYVSLERNMKCAIGHCGHCQLAHRFVCKDGPVFPVGRIGTLLGVREL
jgi:NAD(P)H-flavin reductase